MQSSNLTLFAEGSSWLHSRHPFSKLSYIVLIGVAAYCAPVGLGPKTALLAFNVMLAAWSGILSRVWGLAWRILLPLALFMFPIHGLLFPNNQTAIFSFQGITLYAEGLLFAGTILVQLAAVLSASLLFVLTTHPADLISALAQAGWPPFVSYIMGSPLLMMPAMRARTVTIQAAQQARGLDSKSGIMGRIRSLPALVTPLVLGAFSEIEHRAVALELRGFSVRGPRTSLREVPDSRLQRAIRWLMLTVSLGLIVYALAT